jgi:hypothetical protein
MLVLSHHRKVKESMSVRVLNRLGRTTISHTEPSKEVRVRRKEALRDHQGIQEIKTLIHPGEGHPQLASNPIKHLKTLTFPSLLLLKNLTL